MSAYNTVDVTMYPVFKKQTLALIDELDLVFNDPEFSESAKANRFHTILKKYDAIS